MSNLRQTYHRGCQTCLRNAYDRVRTIDNKNMSNIIEISTLN